MLALEPLLIPAERLGVAIGIEIRNHLHEVPSPNEIARILETFHGAPIGYWHDVGHAEVQERVGLLNQQAVLDRFTKDVGEQLLGVHLHDVRGLEDHLPPGQGTVDFTRLAPLLAGCFKVLEVRPAPVGQVREGVEVLRSAGIL
jgi:sugar phosphate isomerase/epimerase